MIIDARHQSCPIPVILANKEIEKNNSSFTILVDNAIAVENLKKLAKNKGVHLEFSQRDSDYTVIFTASNQKPAHNDSITIDNPKLSDSIENWVLFVGKETIGEGDPTLGSSLMTMYFYTLSQGHTFPQAILFMNNGVKLPSNNIQIIAHLTILLKRGCKILVCGACLDFYKLTEKLQIGEISNMYAITEEMNLASKVVTL